MKVALVHDFLVKLGGGERVLAVLADLYPHAPIYTLLYDESRVGHVFPKDRVRPSGLQNLPDFIKNRRRYLFPFMPRMIESFNLSGYDLVISSSSAYAHGILTNTGTKHLCYCHSPMRYAWDWTHEYIEEQRIGALKTFMLRSLMKKVRLWDYYSSDRVDSYLANSKNVQQRIQKYYHQPSEVLYPPVDVDRFKVTGSHENFFLIVSTLTPYKRVELAVQLFNKIRKRLVIIGEGSDRERLQRFAGPHIDFLGYKPDEVVREYIQNCRAFIFPGEEDFGIAPVEAMAAGKPVLAYGKGGVTESVVPGLTGEFFNEPTIDSMEDALARLLASESRYDSKHIRRQAERFQRSLFEDGIKECVRKVMQSQ
ncbi:MAG: glycosyltransferase [Candidatus Gracilibacteria bacterium]